MFVVLFQKTIIISISFDPETSPASPWKKKTWVPATVHGESQGREIFQHEGHKKNDTLLQDRRKAVFMGDFLSGTTWLGDLVSYLR